MTNETRTVECRCGETVELPSGWANQCGRCGTEYNGSGQRLRDDWRGNPSLYDDEIGDLEGYEIQHADDW
ncbi:hypothetical protein [Mycolicibacterium fallax]|nr:hypothetical protein [Mycolicibacterium fallax]